MALIIGTDTYITAADCSTYLASVYLSTDAKLIAWNALSEANKDICLRNAAKIIDRQPLQGVKYLSTQTMEFPRATWTDYGDNDWRVRGVRLFSDHWYSNAAVPDKVKLAQCEIALDLAQGTTDAQNRAELQRQGVKSFSVGKLSESYSGVTGDITSAAAKQLLIPFVARSVRIV